MEEHLAKIIHQLEFGVGIGMFTHYEEHEIEPGLTLRRVTVNFFDVAFDLDAPDLAEFVIIKGVSSK